MKPDLFELNRSAARVVTRELRWRVRGETDPLTDVLLCPPAHLEPVPCCAVTCESLQQGFATDVGLALNQHRALADLLAAEGVRCHGAPPVVGLADLCFTRDCVATTPWGPVLLNPALPHRARERQVAADTLAALGAAPIATIGTGTIEGGDVCVARDGLLIVGLSGERTDRAGAETFAAPFREEGWTVLFAPFDPVNLHLDTIFCMLDAHHVLACIDALDPAFVEAVTARGITLLPVSHAECLALGCNVLSLDGHRIVVRAGQPRIEAMLRDAGFTPLAADVSQFAACGGGIHCLTMPLARQAA